MCNAAETAFALFRKTSLASALHAGAYRRRQCRKRSQNSGRCWGTTFRVSSALLAAQTSIPAECGAIVVAADLSLPDNIAALKEAAEKFNGIRRRVFVIDQKARLFAAQAYALGATQVFFNSVDQRSLVLALANSVGPAASAAQIDRASTRCGLWRCGLAGRDVLRGVERPTRSTSRTPCALQARLPRRSPRTAFRIGWRRCGGITKVPTSIACW